jgi:hypothetical protein
MSTLFGPWGPLTGDLSLSTITLTGFPGPVNLADILGSTALSSGVVTPSGGTGNTLAALFAGWPFIATSQIGADNGVAPLDNHGNASALLAQSPYGAQNTPITLGQSAANEALPSLYGAVGDGSTDDGAALNAMFADLPQIYDPGLADRIYDINLRGRIYATSVPLNVCSNIKIYNGAFTALPGGTTPFGPANGVINIPAGKSSVFVDDVWVNCNRVPNCNGFYVAAAGFIEMIRVKAQRWVGTPGGSTSPTAGMVINGGKPHLLFPAFRQWNGSDPEYSTVTNYTGAGLWSQASSDWECIGGVFTGGAYGIRLDSGTHNVRFVSAHPYQPNQNFPFTGPLGGVYLGNVLYNGYNCIFESLYLDNGPFVIAADSTTNNGDVNVAINMSNPLYNLGPGNLAAEIILTTSATGTTMNNLVMGKNAWTGKLPILSFPTSSALPASSAGGTWGVSAAILTALMGPTAALSLSGVVESLYPGINGLGVSTFAAFVRSLQTKGAAYTVQQTDGETTIFITSSNGVLTLPNNLTPGTEFTVATNSSGVQIQVASGAKIGGNATIAFYMQAQSAVLVKCVINSTGTTAGYEIIGNGNSCSAPAPTQPTVTASPMAYTALFYGWVLIVGFTGSATFKRGAAGTAYPLDQINGRVPVTPGDIITLTYTVAGTITAILT